MDVSVIIPTYCPGAYLWECLDSLWAQTLSHNRFEIIIVLNGCDEPFRSEIENWLKKKDDNIDNCIIQTDQEGVSNARNMGIDIAKGQYICFIDDDDWVSDNYLENLLFESCGENTIVVANELHYHEREKTYTTSNLGRKYKKLSITKKKITLLAARPYMSTSCLKIIPYKMIGSTRFNLKLKLGEDALFMAQVSRYIKTIRLASANTLYYRRIREGSATTQKHHFWSLVKNTIYQQYQYTRTFLSDPLHYDFLFFFNRLLAVTQRFFKLLIGRH